MKRKRTTQDRGRYVARCELAELMAATGLGEGDVLASIEAMVAAGWLAPVRSLHGELAYALTMPEGTR
jgi:DNA-binding transcriptional regulator PaaX